jgi:hypothetical protein
MATPELVRSRPLEAAFATNKLIRNTYTLLSMTLIFSALMAGVSVVLRMPPMTYLLALGGAFLLIWFVLPRTANSAKGLGVVFAITGLLGFSLGPILTMYLSLANGPQIVGMAFAGTGVIFLGLSGYALTSRKDERIHPLRHQPHGPRRADQLHYRDRQPVSEHLQHLCPPAPHPRGHGRRRLKRLASLNYNAPALRRGFSFRVR